MGVYFSTKTFLLLTRFLACCSVCLVRMRPTKHSAPQYVCCFSCLLNRIACRGTRLSSEGFLSLASLDLLIPFTTFSAPPLSFLPLLSLPSLCPSFSPSLHFPLPLSFKWTRPARSVHDPQHFRLSSLACGLNCQLRPGMAGLPLAPIALTEQHYIPSQAHAARMKPSRLPLLACLALLFTQVQKSSSLCVDANQTVEYEAVVNTSATTLDL